MQGRVCEGPGVTGVRSGFGKLGHAADGSVLWAGGQALEAAAGLPVTARPVAGKGVPAGFLRWALLCVSLGSPSCGQCWACV